MRSGQRPPLLLSCFDYRAICIAACKTSHSVLTRIDCNGKELSLGTFIRDEQLVIYRGVEYSVTATGEPDIWQWRFQIGESAIAGKTRTRLIHLATRRVQMKIDAALRALNPTEHAERARNSGAAEQDLPG